MTLKIKEPNFPFFHDLEPFKTEVKVIKKKKRDRGLGLRSKNKISKGV